MKYLIGFLRSALALHIHSYSNLPSTISISGVFISVDKEAFFLSAVLLRRTTVCLLSTTTNAPAAAAPRGYHFEIIIGIQFSFVNGDRALLHLDSWTCLMWSSAFSLSVASLSLKLLSPTSPDRRASHSSLKALFFFFSFCPFPVRGEIHGTLSPARPRGSPPLPKQPTSGLSLGWISSSLYPWLGALRSVWPETHGCKCANTETSVHTCAECTGIYTRVYAQRHECNRNLWFLRLEQETAEKVWLWHIYQHKHRNTDVCVS